MSDDGKPEGTEESGSALRSRLEQSETEGRETRRVLNEQLAAGYAHVKPEDLAGVALADLPAKAAELEETRAKEADATFRSQLAARGLDEAQIDQLMATPPAKNGGDPAPASAAPSGVATMESIGQLGGQVVRRQPGEGLQGPDLIRAGCEADER